MAQDIDERRKAGVWLPDEVTVVDDDFVAPEEPKPELDELTFLRVRAVRLNPKLPPEIADESLEAFAARRKWRGRPLAELSRDELLSVIQYGDWQRCLDLQRDEGVNAFTADGGYDPRLP
jgi:hypothetical protein